MQTAWEPIENGLISEAKSFVGFAVVGIPAPKPAPRTGLAPVRSIVHTSR